MYVLQLLWVKGTQQIVKLPFIDDQATVRRKIGEPQQIVIT